jgi:toxin HigB-1
MIRSFKHDGIERFFKTESKAGIQPKHATRLKLQLQLLNTAESAVEMNVPGWNWHPLQSDLAGHWAVKVNGNWRLTFSFEGKDAVLVDYQDYHWGGFMGEMFNPPHPGLILRDTVLREDGGISVKEFAEKLGMTRTAISRVVNGKAAVSPELAIRLAALLNVTARSWLTMQVEYDLWQLRNKRRPKIRRLAA